MPVVHPADIWKETDRWFQIGSEMGRFKDKNERDMVLAMTHEEVVADLDGVLECAAVGVPDEKTGEARNLNKAWSPQGDLGDIRYISARRLNLGLFQKDINVAWDLITGKRESE